MSGSKSVSTKEQRIAEVAKNAPDMAMDVSHHLDLEWFVEAFRRTRRDSAVGVGGNSDSEHGASLDERIGDLIGRAKSGRYRAHQ
ncbi:MAG: hypothetical protein GY811_23635 [Myxococcales bacterium]|nr:hypothetical protein [Myxococcales bacterium]